MAGSSDDPQFAGVTDSQDLWSSALNKGWPGLLRQC